MAPHPTSTRRRVEMSKLGLTDKDLERFVKDGMCTWIEDEDGLWHTECHQIHQFFDGTPTENFYKYCPYCGKFLVVGKYKEDR
jgi:hypothetical protein